MKNNISILTRCAVMACLIVAASLLVGPISNKLSQYDGMIGSWNSSEYNTAISPGTPLLVHGFSRPLRWFNRNIWERSVYAQQQMVPVPSAATAVGLAVTGTTTVTTTATTAKTDGTGGSTALAGTHGIYGWTFTNSNLDTCWLQVMDTNVATAGTTRPKISIPIYVQSSSGGMNPLTVISPFPLFTMTSTLSFSIGTTPTNATTCGSGLVIGHFYYK